MHALHNGLITSCWSRFDLEAAASALSGRALPMSVDTQLSATRDAAATALQVTDYGFIAAFAIAVVCWGLYQRKVFAAELAEENRRGLITDEEAAGNPLRSTTSVVRPPCPGRPRRRGPHAPQHAHSLRSSRSSSGDFGGRAGTRAQSPACEMRSEPSGNSGSAWPSESTHVYLSRYELTQYWSMHFPGTPPPGASVVPA